jgi:hypothetical protein
LQNSFENVNLGFVDEYRSMIDFHRRIRDPTSSCSNTTVLSVIMLI